MRLVVVLPQRGEADAEWSAEPRLKDDLSLTDMSGVLAMPPPDPEDAALPASLGVPGDGDESDATACTSAPTFGLGALSPESPVALLELSRHQASILERHFGVHTVRELAHLSAVVQAVTIVKGAGNPPGDQQ
jgi:hypothetical protein